MKFKEYINESEMIRQNPIKDVWSKTRVTKDTPNGWKVKVVFTCPKCKYTEKVTPEFKKKYYSPSGDLIVTCPKCKQKYLIPY
jgi:ssDNA-binding Zn-finger/Zn-ribbon topoisomerase 1